jgi:hypothetical protein
LTNDIAKIIALEEERCQAELDNDSAALERLLDDDLLHVHTGGTVDGKAALIAARKAVKFRTMKRKNLKVKVSGDIAIMTGGIFFEVLRPGTDQVFATEAFVTQVLARVGDGWRFVLYQGTALKK